MRSEHISEVTQIETNLDPDSSDTCTGERPILPGVHGWRSSVVGFCGPFFEIPGEILGIPQQCCRAVDVVLLRAGRHRESCGKALQGGADVVFVEMHVEQAE